MGAYEYRNDIYIWEGQNSDWKSNGNWNGNEIPKNTDIAIISSLHAVADPEVDTDEVTVGTLLIESGVLIVSLGKLTVSGL